MNTHIRFFIFKLASNSSLLSSIFNFYYHLSVKIYSFIFSFLGCDVYFRRGFSRGEIKAGISDLDPLIVLKSDSIREFRRAIVLGKGLAFIFPLIKDQEVFTKTMFTLWKKSFDYRSFEFQEINLKNNIDNTILENFSFRLSATHEVVRSYYSMLKNLYSKENFNFKMINHKKHICDIFRIYAQFNSVSGISFKTKREYIYFDYIQKNHLELFLDLENENVESSLKYVYSIIENVSENFLESLENFTQSHNFEFPDFHEFKCSHYRQIYDLPVIRVKEKFRLVNQGIFSSKELFRTMKISGFQEHEILKYLIAESQSEDLINYYKFRLLYDFMGGVINEGTVNLFSFMLIDADNFLSKFLNVKDSYIYDLKFDNQKWQSQEEMPFDQRIDHFSEVHSHFL